MYRGYGYISIGRAKGCANVRKNGTLILYRFSLRLQKEKKYKGEELDDREVSDDDLIEESTDGTSVGMGMTREEKIKVRKPWRNSLIIKLVGRSIGYRYLWRRIQLIWLKQDDPLIIDLVNREEYEAPLVKAPG